MDLGVGGRKAIVCAASKGLGRACAMALAREGVSLVINARGAEALEATAQAIREGTGAEVAAVAVDITTDAGRDAVLAACPDPDILINNAGGPPPGDFRAWGRDAWLAAVEANMLTPILLIKAVVDGMIERRFGRIVNITTGGVKAPASLPHLGLSLGARTGLTGFVGLLARQTVRHNVTINSLLPGQFATDRMRSGLAYKAKQAGIEEGEAERLTLSAIPAGRFGTPEEFGQTCAFLCSAQAGYLTGQNILMDGGAFPGLL
jgi:3-oxoacyl-[acyl-carrier protein] reductase